MKNFVLLSLLSLYFGIGFCIEESNIDAHSDVIGGNPALWHPAVSKRNTAFKRLPAWSVYYGKRSIESPIDQRETENIDLEKIVDTKTIGDEGSDLSRLTFPDLLYFTLEQRLHDSDSEPHPLEATKRANFKRLQSWLSTYGKRSLIDTGYATEKVNSEEGIDDDLISIKRSQEVSGDADDMQSQYDIEAFKRAPGWHATYGKRSPSWPETYSKHNLLSAFEKRMAGWSAMYGKRAPAWSISYGKRAPSWSITYGKRLPGWSATYGKRVVPWGITYGKRIPWGATYGKRSQGWNAFYGKRAPMWQAVYGKRDEMSELDQGTDASITDKSEDTSDIDEKRSQAWSAFYGR